jgi:hypothetical protein
MKAKTGNNAMLDYSVTFKGLTKSQAKTLAEWYSGQGEQEAQVWFDENCSEPVPTVDIIDKKDPKNIVIHCY